MNLLWWRNRSKETTAQLCVTLLDDQRRRVGAPQLVRFKLRADGQWSTDEPVTFPNLPAGTYTHVLVNDQLVPIDQTGWARSFTIPPGDPGVWTWMPPRTR